MKQTDLVGWDSPGVTLAGTAGEDLYQFIVVYSDPLDSGKWKKAQQDGTDQEADAWGITLQPISNDAEGPILIFGIVTNSSWTLTPGKVVWLSDTAGALTDTQPAGYYLVRLGHAVTSTSIFFNPSAPVAPTA